MGDMAIVVLGVCTFIFVVAVAAWVTKPGRVMTKLPLHVPASRRSEIRELGMEAERIVERLELPEELKASDIETIHSAVHDGLTDRMFTRHYIGLLGYLARYIGKHRGHVIETVIYTATFVPDEDPDAEIPDHLIDEHFLLGEAFLDAVADERLQVPIAADGSPDRENGDCFYTLLSYALEHPEYGWMLLDIAIDHGISDLEEAKPLLEQAKLRGFDALLTSSR